MSNPSKEYKAAWYQANKQRLKAARVFYRQKNKDRIGKSVAKYHAEHPKLVRQIKKKWSDKNKGYYASKCAERYARKTSATPKWANKFFIQEAYLLAALRTKVLGFAWQVDHIVPLRSKGVCGLHVEHNLQVIPAEANYKKKNLHWPDMP